MSPRSKTGGYDAWVTRFRNTTAIEVTSASTVVQTGASATVQVTFVSTDRENGRVVTRTFSGTWQLVNGGGAWLLDESSMRQAS